MISPAIQTVIFDLGKTLIPFSLAPLQARLNAQPGDREAARHLFQRFECGGLEPEAFQEAVCGLTRLSAAEFGPWWNSIFEPRLLIPEAWLRLLLRRYRCGLLSNTNALHFAFLLTEQPVLAQFAFRILSHEVGAAKPEPLIFEAAEAAAHCRPESILYFDDIPEFVAAARRRGWQAHQFTEAQAVSSVLPELSL